MAPVTQEDTSADSVFSSQFGDSRLGPAAPAVGGVPDAEAGWIVCEGVAGFASLQEGVRRARAAVERGEHGAMQPVPEPVGDFVKDWMAKRHAAPVSGGAAAHSGRQTVFVLDDASRIWASRLITYLSQAADATSQRLHFIHRSIAGATVSLAQVCLGAAGAGTAGTTSTSAKLERKHVYWADARGRGRASHEVRDAFSANGDVLVVLIGPMSANAFEKVSGMLRGQWELRRGSLQRVVLLVTHDSPPPRAAVDALLEDFAGTAQAAYVNLADTGQCWQALLAAAQGLQPRRAAAPVSAPTPQPASGPESAPTLALAQFTESPALDLLDLYAGSEGLHSVAMFNHLGDLLVQRAGTSWTDEAQVSLFLSSDDANANASPKPNDLGPPDHSPEGLRRVRQGQALRALLGAAGLQPPRRLMLENAEAFDIVEPVLGMPTLWLWSHFDAQHMATVQAQALSSRLAFDLAQVLSSHDEPLQLLGRPAQGATATQEPT
jgi:hypothetical protein